MARLEAGSAAKTLLLACIAMTMLLPERLVAADYALIMPGAATSLLLDIAAAGDRLVAVGERGHILYSSDGGETWVQARVPTSVMLTRVFFVNGNLGWAVGHDGNILVSEDGGSNWRLQRDGVTDQASINEKQQAAPQEPVYPPPLMDIWFSDADRGWAAGAFGTLLHTANGGRNWDDRANAVDNPDGLHFNGIAGGPDSTLYLASEWGYVFRSGDGGESWEAVATGYDGSFFGVVVNPATGSVFAYGLRGHIYRSLDRGASWEPLTSGAGASLFGAASEPGGGLVFVGQDGTVIRTRDDGASFHRLDARTERGLYGVAPVAPDRLVVTGDGGSAAIIDTTDTGR